MSDEPQQESKREKKKESRKAELIVVLIILLGLASFVVPIFTKVIANHQQVKSISLGKNLLTAMALFASDKGSGSYPNGSFDTKTKEPFTSPIPATLSEACFQDLFKAEILINEEFLFWLRHNNKQCNRDEPDDNGILEPGENGWDYIAGLNNTSGSLPLIIEASDSGKGRTWTAEGGHPWDGSVVVGYADGASTRKESLVGRGEVKTKRGGKEGVHLAVPIPGTDGWPASARYIPATPVK